jgi:hypothetical protein
MATMLQLKKAVPIKWGPSERIAGVSDSGFCALPEQTAAPREVTALGTMIPQCPLDKPGR